MATLVDHQRIMSGKGGAWESLARGGLSLLEHGYSAVVRRRNESFDRHGPRYTAPIPVISLGNITVGGTGKTPLVIEIVRRLGAMGRKPCVVSRGYGGADGGPHDEELLIRRRCPGLTCVSDPDRTTALRTACEKFGAEVVVLDDGFQHRRVARNLDIVLIDATCPFGFDHLLPRGLLREPVSSLGRAHLLVLTRCDQVTEEELASIETRLDQAAPGVIRLRSCHRVTEIRRLNGAALSSPLDGQPVFLFAAIGRPGAFENTVRSVGAEIVGHRWFADHHRFRREEIDALCRGQRSPAFDWLMTTEKDAVKLLAMGGFEKAPIAVVRVAIDFLGDGGARLDRILRDALAATGRP